MKNPLEPKAICLFEAEQKPPKTKIFKNSDKQYKRRIVPMIKDFTEVRVHEILQHLNK